MKKLLKRIALIKQTYKSKYGTDSHGNPAYDALVSGIGENDIFYTII